MHVRTHTHRNLTSTKQIEFQSNFFIRATRGGKHKDYRRQHEPSFFIRNPSLYLEEISLLKKQQQKKQNRTRTDYQITNANSAKKNRVPAEQMKLQLQQETKLSFAQQLLVENSRKPPTLVDFLKKASRGNRQACLCDQNTLSVLSAHFTQHTQSLAVTIL